MKKQCRVCEREIGQNPITSNLSPHKISLEKWRSISPFPYGDGRCPGK